MRSSVFVVASTASCGSRNSLATRRIASAISSAPSRIVCIVVSASLTPLNASSSVSRLDRTSSRINRSISLAPSASVATSSSTFVVVVEPTLASALAPATALDRLNASRAYATASNVVVRMPRASSSRFVVVVACVAPLANGSSDGFSRTTRRSCSIIGSDARCVARMTRRDGRGSGARRASEGLGFRPDGGETNTTMKKQRWNMSACVDIL